MENGMGLRTKFNLVMITAFLIGLAVATFLAREITTEEAKRQMLNEATLIMRSGTDVRGYTQYEIRPVITQQMAVRCQPRAGPSSAAHTVAREHRDRTPGHPDRAPAPHP